MSEVLNTAPVKNGQLLLVGNKEKVKNAKTLYYAIWVENIDGKNETCLFFTQTEMATLQPIDIDFLEEMVPGRIYKCGAKNSNVIKIVNGSSEFAIRLTKTLFNKALYRARKNEEDIPKKTFINDLLD